MICTRVHSGSICLSDLAKQLQNSCKTHTITDSNHKLDGASKRKCKCKSISCCHAIIDLYDKTQHEQRNQSSASCFHSPPPHPATRPSNASIDTFLKLILTVASRVSIAAPLLNFGLSFHKCLILSLKVLQPFAFNPRAVQPMQSTALWRVSSALAHVLHCTRLHFYYTKINPFNLSASLTTRQLSLLAIPPPPHPTKSIIPLQYPYHHHPSKDFLINCTRISRPVSTLLPEYTIVSIGAHLI